MATRSPDERRKAGAALRRAVPRSAQGKWTPPADRADPVEVLIEQGKSRIQELLPIRYGRMRSDPFAFLRGAAAVMAADLARTPATGIRMQACGDAHLANFGSYATPEGLPVFDINDFDETLPAPSNGTSSGWRPASSWPVASPSIPRKPHAGSRTPPPDPTASTWPRWLGYRRSMPGTSISISPGRLPTSTSPRCATRWRNASPGSWRVAPSTSAWRRRRTAAVRIREKPPLIYHLSKHALPARKAFASYAETLQEDRRVLLHRHTLRDVAFKAVGVGSVGTFCAIGLLTAGDCSSQAATSNSVAMNLAWALMSLPPMFRTCPFLIIAIAS